MQRWTTTALGAVMLGATLGAQAPARRGMTFEDVLMLRTVSDPQPSPDGAWIAYVVGGADTVANESTSAIWLARADGSAPPRRSG